MVAPLSFAGLTDFWAVVAEEADDYRVDRQGGQPVRLELWCETAGMVPQLTRIGAEFGIACFSGGGFDGLSGKRDAALRAMEGDRKTVVLHLGDYDPSREHLFSSLAEDVIAFAEASGGEVAFERVAVAPEQIITYGLPTVLQDRRGPLDRVTLPRATSAPSAQPVRRGWSGTSRGFGWRTFRPRRRWPERRPSVGGWPIWYDRSPEEMTRRAAGSSS